MPTFGSSAIWKLNVWIRYGLEDWGIRFRFPAGAKDFHLHKFQTRSGVHLASYRGLFLRGQNRCASDHSTPISDEVICAWSYTSTSRQFFIEWRLIKHRDNLTLPLFKFLLNIIKIQLCSQRKQTASSKTCWLILFQEIIAICFDTHTIYIYIYKHCLWAKCRDL